MFDFDELSGEESEAKQQPQEVHQLSEVAVKTGSPSKAAVKTCVQVSHAIHGWTIAVFLPEKALFKDLRHSLATYFLQDSKVSSFSGQLMHKEGGVYRPYKDKDAIGSTREVLLAGFEGEPPATGLEIQVAEEDLKDQDCQDLSKVVQPASLDEFLILQKELKAGFADENFQEKLRQLQAQCERREIAKTKFLAERQKLFLTVQSEVLPRYGYEGSSNGVYKMMGDMKPYIKDPQFIELADEINCLLGINYSPSESWESLSDNCQKLNEEKVGPVSAGRRSYAHELRPPMGLLGPVPSLLNGKPLRLPDFILGNP